MPDEKVDICNEQGEFLHQGMKRKAHANALWHKVVHIWIYNSRGQVMLQKRTIDKTTHSGLWDASCGGHVGSGEGEDVAAVRELGEELGLDVKIDDLLKDKVLPLKHDDPVLKYYNREFAQVYYYKWDGEIDELKLQEEEVGEVRWLNLSQFQDDLNNSKIRIKYVEHGDYYLEIVKKLEELMSI